MPSKVKVEKLKGLSRSISVSIPDDEISKEVDKKLKTFGPKAKIGGFRPGKAPMHVLKLHYGDAARHEVINDVMRASFEDAIKEHKLNPAGAPNIDIKSVEAGKPFEYVATFEIYPEFELANLSKIKVQKHKSEITDADVEDSIEKLRKQHADWEEVDRAAKMDDRVEIDFDVSIKGEPVPNGQGEHQMLVLGSQTYVPGFEEKMVGTKKGDETEFKLKFPKDYMNKDIAGKQATFKVKVHKVFESELPELNDGFAKRLGVEDATLDALREKVRESLEKQLEDAIKSHLRHQVIEQLMKHNNIDVPNALVDQEVDHLKKQAEQSGMPADAAALESEARKRVRVGLLFAKLIEVNNIKADDKKVRETIEEYAKAFPGQQEQVIAWYYGDKQRLADIESRVIEESVIENVLSQAKISEKKVNFEQAVKWQST